MSTSIYDLKKGFETADKTELSDYCLRLAKYKKENKELLGFLLYEAGDLAKYSIKVNEETSSLFKEINKSKLFYIKKSIRKILRNVNKHIRFAGSKQLEAEVLIHFCKAFDDYSIPYDTSIQLGNIYNSQKKKIEEVISTLHPDLQYDLKKLLEE